MKDWLANIGRATVVVVLLGAFVPRAVADEGMWLVTQIAGLSLRDKGLAIDPATLFQNGKPSIGHAILNLGGGTGSFVSAQGLVLTNHHVAYDGIRSISTPENNYVRDGFLAEKLDDERRVRNYSATITLSCEDVTAEVLEGLADGASAEEREKHVTKAMEALQKERENKRTDKHVRFRVAELFNGAKYVLYANKRYPDVRLVYAPPAAIGEFGGDPDNWMWPRHCGDFSYMRVYADADGEPAAYSVDNAPLQPKSWLRVTADGVKEGDFTFIMGFPGTTNRQRTSLSAKYHRDEMLPRQVDMIQSRVDQMLEQMKEDEETKIRLLSQLKGMQNALKNYAGKMEWLERKKLVEAMEADERSVTEQLGAKPELQRKYGDIFIELKKVYRGIKTRDKVNIAMAQLRRAAPFRGAARLFEMQTELARPEEQRSRAFKENRIERTRARAVAAIKRGEADQARKAVRRGVLALTELPPDGMPGTLRDAVAGTTGEARDKAVDAYVAMLAKSAMFDGDRAKEALEQDAEAIAKSDDPMLVLVRELDESTSAVSIPTADIGRRLKHQRRRYYELRNALDPKRNEYPDADRSLRFTYGYVKGYQARDAVTYDYITSLGGAVEKETGKVPFANPPRLLDLHAKRDFGRYVDAHVNDVPIAFVHDTDITGGNSGSPVLNAKGEMIGIAFDGNWEAITSDYRFDAKLTRTISVDMRYVLWVTEKFAGAQRLLDEMKVAP